MVALQSILVAISKEDRQTNERIKSFFFYLKPICCSMGRRWKVVTESTTNQKDRQLTLYHLKDDELGMTWMLSHMPHIFSDDIHSTPILSFPFPTICKHVINQSCVVSRCWCTYYYSYYYFFFLSLSWTGWHSAFQVVKKVLDTLWKWQRRRF